MNGVSTYPSNMGIKLKGQQLAGGRMSYQSSDNDRNVRLQFMRIDGQTGAVLQECWKMVKPHLPNILDGFYRHAAAVPALAALVGNQIPRLKDAQAVHWERLFNGRFDETYMRSVHEIGMAHCRIGLEPRWYIGGYNFVMMELLSIAISTHRKNPALLNKMLAAMTSAIMLDMDIALSTYQSSVLEERQRRQNERMEAIASFDAEASQILDSFGSSAEAMQHNALTLLDTTGTVTDRAAAVAAASEEASVSVQTVASATEQLAASINEINRQVGISTDITGQAVAQANNTNVTVQSLSEAAQKVGDVVALINDIAAQTNLLALNATIEAARAGDAGKGFAVVANEVKSLANQTSRATEEIAQQVSAIQNATNQSVSAIKEIAETISRVNDIAATISATVDDGRAAAQEIARNVAEASTGTQEVTRNIIGINQTMDQVHTVSSDVKAASDSVVSKSNHLKSEMHAFFMRIQAK